MEQISSDKYIIFLDVDGTVFDGKEVPKRTSDAVILARKLGHKVFINSGRAHCVIPDYILDNVSHDGVIGGMGTAITVGGKLIYSQIIDRDTVEFLLRFGEEHGYFTIAESIDRLFIMNGKQILNQKNFINSTDEFFEKYYSEQITKITFYNTVLPHSEIDFLRRKVDNIYVLSDYVEIPAKNATRRLQ